jgi:uncharacterized YigZ family protein
MIESFQTIATTTEGIHKSKGSKFISFAIPVKTVEEIKEVISGFRKKFHDARHICYAYVLGSEGAEFRANDDGEPSGTAGRPILGQIHSKGVTDVLVVVVRYFGGVLLGTGGLVSAYKEAASVALKDAVVVVKNVEIQCEIHFQYQMMNEVMKLVKDSESVINNQYFENECVLKCLVPVRNEKELFDKLKKIDDVRIIFC